MFSAQASRSLEVFTHLTAIDSFLQTRHHPICLIGDRAKDGEPLVLLQLLTKHLALLLYSLPICYECGVLSYKHGSLAFVIIRRFKTEKGRDGFGDRGQADGNGFETFIESCEGGVDDTRLRGLAAGL